MTQNDEKYEHMSVTFINAHGETETISAAEAIARHRHLASAIHRFYPDPAVALEDFVKFYKAEVSDDEAEGNSEV